MAGICSACEAEIGPEYRFCPHCGADRTDPEGETHMVPPPPGEGVCIEFPQLSSASFKRALILAKRVETFQQYGEGKDATYRVSAVKSPDVVELLPLAEEMAAWRKKKVYESGRRSDWKTVFGFAECYRACQSSYSPDGYCFGTLDRWRLNPWGCMEAHMPLVGQPSWLRCGKWIGNNGDWVFDRERIRLELDKALHHVRHCPMLSRSIVERALALLPDVVNPASDPDWEFIRGAPYDRNGLLVRTWITKDYYTDMVAIGVRPVNENPVRRIFGNLGDRRLPGR